MEHPTKKPLTALLEPGHLEDRQASPEGKAKGLSLVGLVKVVSARHIDHTCVVKSGLQNGPATSLAQHCQLRRDGM